MFVKNAKNNQNQAGFHAGMNTIGDLLTLKSPIMKTLNNKKTNL